MDAGEFDELFLDLCLDECVVEDSIDSRSVCSAKEGEGVGTLTYVLVCPLWHPSSRSTPCRLFT